MPLIDTPSKKFAVDLIGPIERTSESRYILTLVETVTRCLRAIALPSIETEQVNEAQLEIVSNWGSQFTSTMMEEVRRVL